MQKLWEFEVKILLLLQDHMGPPDTVVFTTKDRIVKTSLSIKVWHNDRGEPTASVLSADGFPLMAGPNFQPSDGNPIVISILRQLADVLENVPEI